MSLKERFKLEDLECESLKLKRVFPVKDDVETIEEIAKTSLEEPKPELKN